MRAVIQRVRSASVSLQGKEISRIEAGFLVLLAVKIGDGSEQAGKMAEKIIRLRIFDDADGKMNLSLKDKAGLSVLLVSQFTLYGEADKGNRPSFIKSARPEEARPLIDLVAGKIAAAGIRAALGSFGEHMEVSLVNDGPATIILET
ncbi:MAG: D-aminoacyl-tRNA deacylase [Bacillota bacterium]